MKRSSFCIAIEGTDGSGKTTLANDISKYINLNSEEFNDYHAFTISFPFHGSEMYHTIRESLLPGKNIPTDILQTLMILNMKDAFDNFLNDLLEKEKTIIILDRWLLSTIAYNIKDNGTILDSTLRFISKYKKETDDIVYTNRTGTSLNLDISEFSKLYCGLTHIPDYVYILDIGEDRLKKHCESRIKDGETIESNDLVFSKTAKIYKDISDVLTGAKETFRRDLIISGYLNNDPHDEISLTLDESEVKVLSDLSNYTNPIDDETLYENLKQYILKDIKDKIF